MELQMLASRAYSWTGEADPIRYYRLPLVGRLFRRRVARCVSLLPSGDRVLELGYGSGVSFLNLGERYREIHGIDLHNRPGEVARSFAKTELDLHLRQGSITELPYDDESFDSALAISIHEELPPHQQRRAFAEVHRVLRTGGCYVVGVPGVNVMMNSAFYALGCNIGKYHVTTDREVLSLMSERFELDVTDYSPRFWPKSLTTYLCIRGWKR